MDFILTPEEVRVLGSLLEKEMSTPEYYPLSLNALISACNQKTSRSPVVSYDGKTVIAALARLEKKRLVWQSSLDRVPKYEQSFVKNTKLINSEAAVLSMLMLRGPQTIGEIKAHTERLYAFADLEKVNETLLDLIEAGFIIKSPRIPGQKESRYSHILSGRPENKSPEVPDSAAMDRTFQDGDERITTMQGEMKALRRDFEELRLKVTAFMEQFK